jgi:hypothetical protein
MPEKRRISSVDERRIFILLVMALLLVAQNEFMG